METRHLVIALSRKRRQTCDKLAVNEFTEDRGREECVSFTVMQPHWQDKET